MFPARITQKIYSEAGMGVDDLQDFAKISDAHAEAVSELMTAAATLTIREDRLQSKVTDARHFLFDTSKNIDIGRPVTPETLRYHCSGLDVMAAARADATARLAAACRIVKALPSVEDITAAARD